ncbi:tumor suppressor 2, mitochondrial calcium regulator L homeolog isoform X1 [Xenopus laevis]|uniref:Tumor suppressor 2, mitochondrial calcium regulator L homeolog isoform X1 n=1 Tax=Xenopus laevis TaxID=8355 RepID=A0A8J0USD5_XENLA|nr:tumor suppressor 2, mitochondrial calcium regulator L homeolog isoform X1 [Xenopus laevis]
MDIEVNGAGLSRSLCRVIILYKDYSHFRSMYFDEDGDLAHEFYEETVVVRNGRKRAKLKRIQKNLRPQGIIRLDHPCLHVDFPVVICEV